MVPILMASYDSLLITWVAPFGPPFVMDMTISNILKPPMTHKVMVVLMDGVTRGSVIWRVVCHALAPSSLAAS